MIYSKEWLQEKNKNTQSSKSIKKAFQKLDESESIQFLCDGYGITEIINRENKCYVVKNGEELSFKDVGGIDFKKFDTGIIILLAIVLVFIFGAWIITWFYFKDFKPDERGTYGDMFGTVNALFSGLALAGIIITILLQKKELTYQRRELRQTRKEFEIQNRTLKIQKFENSFFNLISNHKEMMDTIPSQQARVNDKNIKYRYEALKSLKDDFYDKLDYLSATVHSRTINSNNNHHMQDVLNKCDKIIEDYFHIAKDTKLILEFVDRSEINEKDIYYDILSNSLSYSESILFGYYLEFKLEDSRLNENIIERFKSNYFNYIKRCVRKSDVIPPKIWFYQQFESESRKQRNILSANIHKEKIDLLADDVSFGFINTDTQEIKIISIRYHDDEGNIYLKEPIDHIVNEGEEYKFFPLRSSNFNIEEWRINNFPNRQFQYFLELNCSRSGSFLIEYGLRMETSQQIPDLIRVSSFFQKKAEF